MKKLPKLTLFSGLIALLLTACAAGALARANTLDSDQPYNDVISTWGNSSGSEAQYPVSSVILKSSTSTTPFSVSFKPIPGSEETVYIGYDVTQVPKLDIAGKNLVLKDEITIPKGALAVTVHASTIDVTLINDEITIPISGTSKIILSHPAPYTLTVNLKSEYKYSNDGT